LLTWRFESLLADGRPQLIDFDLGERQLAGKKIGRFLFGYSEVARGTILTFFVTTVKWRNARIASTVNPIAWAM
jgi:hypothetical protein